MIKYLKKIALAFWYFIAGIIILIAVIGTLVKAATPILNEHKAEVESFISEKLHHKITIGKIDAKWARFGPEFHLSNVVIYQNDKPFVAADNFTAHIGIFKTMLTKEVFFRSLVLDQVSLNLTETNAHEYVLNGVKLFEAKDNQEFDSNSFLHWLGVQNHLQLTHIKLSASLLGQPEFQAQIANIGLYRNSSQHYVLTAKGEINQQKNSPFELVSHFTGELNDFEKLQGDIYINMQHVPLGVLSPLVSDYAQIHQGDIDASLWVRSIGDQLQQMQAKISANNLSLERQKRHINFQKISTALGWFPEQENHSWKLIAKHFQVQTKNHAAQDMQLIFENNYNQDNQASTKLVSLSHIQLASIRELLKFWGGTPENTQLLLDHLAPKGEVSNLVVKLPKQLDQYNKYLFKAKLNNINTHEYQKYPGISQLSGTLQGSLAQGRYDLAIRQGDFSYEHYFQDKLAIDNSQFQGGWRVASDSFELVLDQGLVNSNSLDADASLFLNIPLGKNHKNNKTFFSLVGGFAANNSKDVLPGVPMNVFSPEVKKWLNHSIGSGKGADGTVVIRGSTDEFPYPKHQGSFIISAKLKPFELNYLDTWPVINNIQGDLVFHNQSLSADITHGTMAGVNITHAKVDIPNLAHNPHLLIAGKTHESTDNAFEFIHQSPLDKVIGQYFSDIDLKGELSVGLRLDLPLLHLDADHIKATGNVLFEKNKLIWFRNGKKNYLKTRSKTGKQDTGNIVLDNFSGKLFFENNIISAEKLSANFDSLPVDFSIVTIEEKNTPVSLNIKASGKLGAKGLADIVGWSQLEQYAKGSTRFQSNMTIPMQSENIGFELNSSLKGMAIALPGMFNKTKQQIKSISLNADVNPKTYSGQFSIDYQDAINSIVHFQHLNQDNYQLQLDARVPQLIWPLPKKDIENLTKNNSAAGQSQNGMADHLTAFKLKIAKAKLYDHWLDDIALSMKKEAKQRVWFIDSSIVKGSVLVPINKSKNKEAKALPITANLDYVTVAIPESAKSTKNIKKADKASSVQNNKKINPDLVTALQAKTWPPLSINIHKLSYNQYYFGQVLLKTQPMVNGVKIENFVVNNPLYKFNLTGQWGQAGKGEISHLKGKASSPDLGKVFLVNKLFAGESSTIQAKKTDIKLDISWPNNLWSIKLGQLSGDIDVSVDDGVIPIGEGGAKMGLGKVLSLFSAQSLERRLKLDFSDLSDQGYSFNTLVSQLNLSKGDAYVKKGEFNGPQAKIDFLGRIGLVKKDYDLTLTVTPYLTSTVPVLAAFAGGPIVGVAAYAVNKLAGSAVAELTSYHYLLHGPWSKPELVDLAQDKTKNSAEQEGQASTTASSGPKKKSFGRTSFS